MTTPAEEALSSAIDTFLDKQRPALIQAVNDIILVAARGAYTDADQPYREVGYDDVDVAVSPLDEMGVNLSREVLSEFIDTHSAVDYCDPHNTGITIYFKSQAILDGFLSAQNGEQPMAQEKSHLLAVTLSGKEHYYKTTCYSSRSELASNLYYARDEKPADMLDRAVSTRTPLSREEYEAMVRRDSPEIAGVTALDFDRGLFIIPGGENDAVGCSLMDATSAGYHIYHDERLSVSAQDEELTFAVWNHRIYSAGQYMSDQTKESGQADLDAEPGGMPGMRQ